DQLDRALVERIRGAGIGDRAAWGELLARYQDRLYAVCLRMVGDRDAAADLTQDAFVKVIQGLDSWDGRSKLSTWMIRVTMNVCLSHLRSEKLGRDASLGDEGGTPLRRGEALGAGGMESRTGNPEREPGPEVG